MKSDNHSKKRKSIRELEVEFSAARDLVDAAQAKAAMARAKADEAQTIADDALDEADRAIDDAIRIGETLTKRIKREETDAKACAADSHFDKNKCSIHGSPRDLMVKALGMLGSDQAGERASAALVVEKQRAKSGKTWDELIVPERDDQDEDDLDEDDDDIDDDDEDLDDDEDDA
jgi:hypothetical protein